MQLTVNSLLGKKITSQEGEHPVKELFYLPREWMLRYALIDTGGWFSREEVLVSADRLSSEDGGGWTLNMSLRELESAPVIDTLDSTASALPPLVVGPFGYTFSPLALAATMENVTAPADGQEPEGRTDGLMRDGGGQILNLDRVSQFLGRDAFDETGDLGQISDMVLSSELVLTHAIMDSGARKSLRNIQRIAGQGHVIFG